jgi:protein-disulfide isomerase
MLIYSEFRCPYCASFAKNTLPELIKEFVDSGKVRLAFWHFPIAEKHPQAVRDAEAADCANQQELFWPMHDELFTRRKFDDGYDDIAQRAGLDRYVFERCMQEIKPDQIEARITTARTLQVSATPTFLIGFKAGEAQVHAVYRIEGARPLEEFRVVLARATRQ